MINPEGWFHDSALVTVTTLGLAGYTLYRNVRDPRNRFFAAFLLSCSFLSLGSFLVFNAGDLEQARVGGLITRWAFVVIPYFFLAFCASFAGVAVRGRRLLAASLTLAVVNSVLTFTPLMVRGYYQDGPYFKPDYGPAYYLFVAHVLAAALLGGYLVHRRVLGPNPYLRHRSIFFLVGFLAAPFLGVLSFFLMDVIRYPTTTLALLVSTPLMAYSFLADHIWNPRNSLRLFGAFLSLCAVVILPFFFFVIQVIHHFHGYPHPAVWMVLLVSFLFLALVFPSIRMSLLEALKRRAASYSRIRREDLVTACTALIGKTNADEIAQSCAEAFLHAVSVEATAIYLKKPGASTLVLVAAAGASRSWPQECDSSQEPLRSFMVSGGITLLQDLGPDTAPTRELTTFVRGVGADVLMPLRAENGAAGIALLADAPRNPILEPYDIETLNLVTPIVAIALRSASGFQNTQASIQLESMSHFVAMIAHEFRNSLLPARTFLELIPEMKEDPEFVGEYRTQALGQLLRALGLVTQLRNLQKGEAPRRARTNLVDVAKSVVKGLEPLASRQGVPLLFRSMTDAVPCLCDEDQISRALANLVLNAIEHSDGQPVTFEITTSALLGEAEADRAVLSIHNAASVPSEQLPFIFLPYFSTRKDKEEEASYGLGLSITQKIVRDHGGTIQVQSAAVAGTTFIVSLPGGAADALPTEAVSGTTAEPGSPLLARVAP